MSGEPFELTDGIPKVGHKECCRRKIRFFLEYEWDISATVINNIKIIKVNASSKYSTQMSPWAKRLKFGSKTMESPT